LKRAGFGGDFLMYSDPICQGPVSDGPDAVAERSQFISDEYRGEDFTQNLEKGLEAEKRLAETSAYERIALWFEHDPYDQLLLVKVLTRLKARGLDARKVELMSLHCFPGITKFIGIGQLSPAALRHMYAKREAVSQAAYELAGEAWSALRSPTPLDLHEISRKNSPALPYLATALRRYLAELPGLADGLSFTERTILEILENGPMPWGRIFKTFLEDLDPLPYHGDLMFLGTLMRLKDAGNPAVLANPADISKADWGKATFELTETGHALLKGDVDWKDCAPRARVHGGVVCFGAPDWRWNRARQIPVQR
jgi:hypothetical protein